MKWPVHTFSCTHYSELNMESSAGSAEVDDKKPQEGKAADLLIKTISSFDKDQIDQLVKAMTLIGNGK